MTKQYKNTTIETIKSYLNQKKRQVGVQGSEKSDHSSFHNNNTELHNKIIPFINNKKSAQHKTI